MNVVIVDYGLGNLRSVAGAVKKLGYDPIISNDIDDIEKADKFILPGVGAFGDGMKNLHALQLIEPLNRMILDENKPILGICLGSQLMAKESFEFGHHKGLGWINASVVRFNVKSKSFRVPHVGWNNLIQTKKDILFTGIPKHALFYYVHSYYAKSENQDIVIGQCEYCITFTAAFHQNNIYGTQFHPEKSQFFGLELLNNYLTKA